MQFGSKKFKITLAGGLALAMVGAFVLLTKPIVHVRCQFGSPTAVTVFAVSNAGGLVLVQDGLASKLVLIDQQQISDLANKADSISTVKEPVVVDPRFAPTDADKFSVETWTNGRPTRKLEANSSDDDAVTAFVQEVFSAAKIMHRYQCS